MDGHVVVKMWSGARGETQPQRFLTTPHSPQDQWFTCAGGEGDIPPCDNMCAVCLNAKLKDLVSVCPEDRDHSCKCGICPALLLALPW